MSRYHDDFDGCCLSQIFYSVVSIVYLIGIIVLIAQPYIYAYNKGFLYTHAIPITVCTLLFIIFKILLNKQKNKVKEIKKNYENEKLKIIKDYTLKSTDLEIQYQKKNTELTNKFDNESTKLKAEYKVKNDELLRQKGKMNLLLTAKVPFRYSASLAADMKCYVYDDLASYLRYKSHPALQTSEEIKSYLKVKTKGYIAQYKEMLYKYEFLLKSFPELQKYVDDEEALQSLDKVNSYTELTENTDRARDYLSDEEWKKLSADERNQLALDRYKKRSKSNWKIGIEYEMYVDFLLRTKYEFNTIPFGSLKGLDDLGRDIIATRIDVSGAISTYIIQCKYWSDKKEIHENVICQIFGTTMEYQLKRNLFKEKVIPVIATTTKLSDMAQKFAQKLGVLVWNIPKGEYPMIKCNIGSSGEKIYHLPFDQQYYRTEIKNPGEFYAWTVKEATSKGFRRALKHILSN